MSRPLSILIAAASLATAQDAPPAAATPATAPASFELKNKSVCEISPGSRAPFWPIGWKPDHSAAPVVMNKKLEIDGGFFKVTSILLGNPSLAVINGRSYEEGQPIRMPKASQQVHAVLYRIGDGQVWIQVEKQIVNTPLRRQELNEKKTGPELLNDERDEPLTPGAPKR